MKQERTKDWVCLVPWAVLTMNPQRRSSTGFTPHELFHGRPPAWFLKTPFPEVFKNLVGDWLEHKQSMANQAGSNLRHIPERELSRRNCLRRPASFKVGDFVHLPPHGALLFGGPGNGTLPPSKSSPYAIIYDPRAQMKHILKVYDAAPLNDRLKELIRAVIFVLINHGCLQS